MPTAYRPEIDGLRAIAVMLVVFFHAKFGFAQGGYLGVDIFFVISGYLISTLIFKDLEKGRFSVLTFYERRARRLLPALFVVLAFSLVFAWVFMPLRQWDNFSESVIWTSFFGSNFFFWLDVDYFGPAADLKPLLHSWSLAVEEQFYLVFPLIALLLAHKKAWLYAGLALLGIASFAACLWAVEAMPRAAFYLAPFRFWEFLIGVFCAVLILRRGQAATGTTAAELACIGGLGMIVAGLFFMGGQEHFSAPKMLIPVAGTALLIVFAKDSIWMRKLLSLKPLVGIGLISYSLYLWHYVLFAFARIIKVGELEFLMLIGLITASIALSGMTWYFVEQPFRKKNSSALNIRTRTLMPSRKSALMAAAIGLMVFGSIGGLQNRQVIDPPRFAGNRAYSSIIKDLVQQRNAQIRLGQCDFFPVSDWKGNWDCGPESKINPNLQRINIAVIGDSHAADKAMILRQQGFEPVQFTGGACAIDPNKKPEACREFFDFAIQSLQNMPSINEIWLSQSFLPNKIRPKAMDRTLKYWSAAGKNLVIFSNMPTFKDTEPDWSRNAASLKPELMAIYDKYNVEVIDVRSIVCTADGNCPISGDDELYYVDQDHLSPAGAKFAGDNLLKIRPLNP